MRLTDVDNLIDSIYATMNDDMDAYMNHDLLEKVIKKIDTAPIADAEPVRHAHYILDAVYPSGIFIYRCSECGRSYSVFEKRDISKEYPYCNCGAKMEEAKDHNG